MGNRLEFPTAYSTLSMVIPVSKSSFSIRRIFDAPTNESLSVDTYGVDSGMDYGGSVRLDFTCWGISW